MKRLLTSSSVWNRRFRLCFPGVLAILLQLLTLSSCSTGREITVGSKNFTEQLILGEIAAQQLERKLHIHVIRKLDLGGTLLLHEAMIRGDIDICPEYTGTAASVILKQKIPDDQVKAYMQVKDAYLKRFQIIWLPPLGFNDTFAMVVRAEDGQRLPHLDLSSAGVHSWRLGVGYEFLTRPDGFERLNQVYSLHWRGSAKTMDLGLLYRALAQRKIDMAAGNSTDGSLTDSQYVVLADDKKAFPPYNACYLIREKVAKEHPEIEWALTMLAGHIGDDTMRDLNRRVDILHEPVPKVAKDFLAGQL